MKELTKNQIKAMKYLLYKDNFSNKDVSFIQKYLDKVTVRLSYRGHTFYVYFDDTIPEFQVLLYLKGQSLYVRNIIVMRRGNGASIWDILEMKGDTEATLLSGGVCGSELAIIEQWKKRGKSYKGINNLIKNSPVFKGVASRLKRAKESAFKEKSDE